MSRLLIILLLSLTLAACDEEKKEEAGPVCPPPPPAVAPVCPEVPPPEEKPALKLSPAQFADLPGWGDDRLLDALPALLRSCQRLLAQADGLPVGPKGLAGTVKDWRGPCEGLLQMPADDTVLRPYLESWFLPYQASDRGEPSGKFTGYYEVEVKGALSPQGNFLWPLYGPPSDLIRIKLGRFRADLEGETLFGRLEGQELIPYHDRAAIDEAHVLSGQGLELIWLDDYVELFFLQVQGSGVVQLPDGKRVRVGFAASNGLPFTAIGRLLKERGELTGGDLSAQGVKAWLRANPEKAWPLMKENARYIFFRMIEGEGPIGAEGLPLSPGRSLAVDPAFLPLGVPLFLSTTEPGGGPALNRLVVAQDTGAAIKGPVRGDLFWGTGEAALEKAGRMNETGRYWLLLPSTVQVPQ